jgi:hypothetical protein
MIPINMKHSIMMVYVEEQFTKYQSMLPLIKRLDGAIHKISIIVWPLTLYRTREETAHDTTDGVHVRFSVCYGIN